MADTTRFGHDQLGHLLADHLMEVPRFQRSYAWDSSNVEEYLADLAKARDNDVDYFMGTVVFANPDTTDGGRLIIVDGQQRLATTAVLLIAVRDRLRVLATEARSQNADDRAKDLDELGQELEKRFLRRYVLQQAEHTDTIILSPNDSPTYRHLLDGVPVDAVEAALRIHGCYEVCTEYVTRLAPTPDDWEKLIDLTTQLEKRVQVLVAEASDFPEAYVIFETLNDRGADLTTADLLKNYLFSASGDYFREVESDWIKLETSFERSEDLVKFIRYDHISRHGSVVSRKLYRAVQDDIGGSTDDVRDYMHRLLESSRVYQAIRDAESPYWDGLTNVNLADSLRAYKRFGFEASIPPLLAAFATWTREDAARLLIKLTNWVIRAQIVGWLGGGTADKAFGETAAAISNGSAINQPEVRAVMTKLIPSDEEFRESFRSLSDISSSRAKYLLAMLEKTQAQVVGRTLAPIEWHSSTVTLEHIIPESLRNQPAYATLVGQFGNLALLERPLNKEAASKPFGEKVNAYRQSSFELTRKLATKRTWSKRSIQERAKELANLAINTWPVK